MEKAGAKSRAALGFLTVLEHPQQGLFGGYLVLNMAGRPLEFHCTAPVKANRAQEILYGPTLEPFLYGEQIGQTLLAKAKTAPLVVCTDRPPALAVRQHVQVPVALVLPPQLPIPSFPLPTPSGESTQPTAGSRWSDSSWGGTAWLSPKAANRIAGWSPSGLLGWPSRSIWPSPLGESARPSKKPGEEGRQADAR
jgi:hypothetical protein